MGYGKSGVFRRLSRTWELARFDKIAPRLGEIGETLPVTPHDEVDLDSNYLREG